MATINYFRENYRHCKCEKKRKKKPQIVFLMQNKEGVKRCLTYDEALG